MPPTSQPIAVWRRDFAGRRQILCQWADGRCLLAWDGCERPQEFRENLPADVLSASGWVREDRR